MTPSRAIDPTRSPVALTRPGETSRTIPAKPIARPTTPLTRIGSSRRKIGEMTMTISGTVELRMAASALSTDCSAQVMSPNGMTMLMTAMTTRCP